MSNKNDMGDIPCYEAPCSVTPPVKKTSTSLDLSKATIADDIYATVSFKDGVKFRIKYMQKSALQKLLRDCLSNVYNPKTKVREQQVDQDRFSRNFISAVVQGWEGVTMNTLSGLMAVDVKALPEEERDLPIDYTGSNMLALIKGAYDLDDFLQNACTDIKYFRSDADEGVLGN